MNEDELIALSLYQHGVSPSRIESVIGIDRLRLSDLSTEYEYDLGAKKIVDEESIVSQYVNGDLLETVGAKHGVSSSTVSRIIRKHGVEHRDFFKELPEDEIVENYRSVPSMNYWGRQYNVDPGVIKRVLVAHNEPVMPQSEAQRQYRFNHHIFDEIDSEEKAYWLGFLFADGSIGSSRDDVKIELADRDIEHVQKFANFVGYKKQLDKPYLSIRSKEMKAGLIKHGCIPRKSHMDIYPEDVPDELHRHFMRGVCDGDGYVGVYAKSASIEIVGGRTLLQWMAAHGLSGDVRPHKTIWRLRSKSNNVLGWGTLLYEDASIYLDRKYDRYLKMKELFNV